MELPSLRCTASREVGIVVSVAHGKVQCVTYRTGSIDVETLSVAHFKEQFTHTLDGVPVRVAARRMLNSEYLAVTDTAQRALRAVLRA